MKSIKTDETLEPLKEAYMDIKIPEGLGKAIAAGIEKGRMERANETSNTTVFSNAKEGEREMKRKNYGKVLGYVAAASILFTASVNLSPAFADQLKALPVIGEIVKVLQFVDGKASGGEITDGTDVSQVDLNRQGETDQLSIRFEQSGAAQDLAGAYEVTYSERPYTMSFAISGARMLSASEDFEKLKASRYVKAVYPIITLDDSMVRFMVVFSGPVAYELKEVKEPASLVLQVKPGEETESSKSKGFAIVTEDMPQGEGMAMLEEIFMADFESMRVLPAQGKPEQYYMEMAQFETEAAAKAKLDALSERLSEQGIVLKVVKRSAE